MTRLCSLLLAALMILGGASCKSRSEAGSGVRDTASELALVTYFSTLMATVAAAPAEQRQAIVLANADEIWKKVIEADRNGSLQPGLRRLLDVAPQTRGMPTAEKDALALTAYSVIKPEIIQSTYAANDPRKFKSWKILAGIYEEKVGGASSGTNLVKSLEQLGNTEFLGLTDYELLINQQPNWDGRKAWETRMDAIRNAKNTVWIFSWAFYGGYDQTGELAAKLLVEKANERRADNPEEFIDVRVMVDGPVNSKPGYFSSTDLMINSKVKVIRWSMPERSGFGMHRKIVIVDHETPSTKTTAGRRGGAVTVFGGKNHGDNYSHINQYPNLAEPARTLELWRDTDMLVTGGPVLQAARMFALRWNEFLAEPGRIPSESPVSSPSGILTEAPMPLAVPQSAANATEKFAFIDQNPVKPDADGLDPVLAVTLKMIASAKSEIAISNAYYMTLTQNSVNGLLVTPIHTALVKAMNDGVQVRIHTNSAQSMTAEDKPLLGPIYRSLAGLLNTKGTQPTFKGPKVHLQKARTLHSKYMVVDGTFGWIGSYNIHPRSSRYEGEDVGMFYGAKIGAEVKAMFETDADPGSDTITDSRMVTPKANEYSEIIDLIEGSIFEQL